MSHAATQAAILAGKYHGNGPHYEKHVKPLVHAANEEERAKKHRAVLLGNHRSKAGITGQMLYLDPKAGPTLPEEIAALCDP